MHISATVSGPQNPDGPKNAGFKKTCYYDLCRYILDKLIGSKDALGFYAVLANLFCSLNRIFPQFFSN